MTVIISNYKKPTKWTLSYDCWQAFCVNSDHSEPPHSMGLNQYYSRRRLDEHDDFKKEKLCNNGFCFMSRYAFDSASDPSLVTFPFLFQSQQSARSKMKRYFLQEIKYIIKNVHQIYALRILVNNPNEITFIYKRQPKGARYRGFNSYFIKRHKVLEINNKHWIPSK